MEEVILEDYPAQRIFMHKKITQQANDGKNASKGIPKFEFIDERCPMHIQNLIELQEKIQNLAAKYSITGNVEIDDGFSFTYQVQVYFTVYYQKQVIESCFGRYNGMAKDPF